MRRCVGGRGHGISRGVTDNGRPRSVPEDTTVAELIAELGLQAEHVAVERNRTIVPRAEHARTVLQDGDRLEIVTFVGGG